MTGSMENLNPNVNPLVKAALEMGSQEAKKGKKLKPISSKSMMKTAIKEHGSMEKACLIALSNWAVQNEPGTIDRESIVRAFNYLKNVNDYYSKKSDSKKTDIQKSSIVCMQTLMSHAVFNGTLETLSLGTNKDKNMQTILSSLANDVFSDRSPSKIVYEGKTMSAKDYQGISSIKDKSERIETIKNLCTTLGKSLEGKDVPNLEKDIRSLLPPETDLYVGLAMIMLYQGSQNMANTLFTASMGRLGCSDKPDDAIRTINLDNLNVETVEKVTSYSDGKSRTVVDAQATINHDFTKTGIGTGSAECKISVNNGNPELIACLEKMLR